MVGGWHYTGQPEVLDVVKPVEQDSESREMLSGLRIHGLKYGQSFDQGQDHLAASALLGVSSECIQRFERTG